MFCVVTALALMKPVTSPVFLAQYRPILLDPAYLHEHYIW